MENSYFGRAGYRPLGRWGAAASRDGAIVLNYERPWMRAVRRRRGTIFLRVNNAMKYIGIRYNEEKVGRRKAEALAKWLKDNGRHVPVVGGRNSELPLGLDMLVVMGGDGTLLGGARAAAVHGVPVFGIDFGGLGFLSEIKYRGARAALKKIFAGEYEIEERLVLEAGIGKAGKERKSLLAINDVVVTKNSGRMLRLKVFINGHYFHEFPGDGLILSTSTGSTAYALSAGGPIVSPELDVIMITPICPHTLFARAIVTTGNDTMRIELPQERGDLVLIVDGQEEVLLKSGDVVTVRDSGMKGRFVRVGGRLFYDTVREKFNLK